MLRSFPYILLRSPLQSLREAHNMSADSKTLFQEGVYLSSPEFWQELQKKGQLSEKEKKKAALSYSKYWLRSCSRCTPYGTFAGSAMIPVTEAPTDLTLSHTSRHRRSLRLDMNYLSGIVHSLIQMPEIQEQIEFFPNNSIYPAPDGYRYAEYSIRDNTRVYELTSVERTSYITALLTRAAGGATLNELSKVLRDIEGVTGEEARGFIIDLWHAQLLTAGLEPALTGEEPLQQLITRLEKLQGPFATQPSPIQDPPILSGKPTLLDKPTLPDKPTLFDKPTLLDKLKEIQYLLSHPGEGVPFYQTVEARLQHLDLNVTVPKNTIQVDLFLSMQEGHIAGELVAAITRQAGELQALARKIKNPDLENFSNKFTARYEEARIPLALALDADLGIGYAGSRDETAGGSEFIDGLPGAHNAGAGQGAPFDYIQQYTLAKYNEWAMRGAVDTEMQNPINTAMRGAADTKMQDDLNTITTNPGKQGIEILEEELKAFRQYMEGYDFPVSMYLMGSLLKQDGLLDATHFTFDLAGLGGPSGANLLGRFTHGDHELAEYVKQILKAEEQERPDAIYAEIVHLPQARIGNILLRPVLRRYEIPYVGLSGAAAQDQLTLDDLLVCVRNGEVVLYSRQHGKRVIPRLTTAHNYTFKSLPVYKFLCDLQGQGLAHPNVWDWGHLTSMKHLPRVTYKNLIVHKAIWKIEERDIKTLPAREEEHAAWFLTFMDKYKIPERVVYKEGDNELLIDFTKEQGIALFLHYIKRNKVVQLEEFLFTEDNCAVLDATGAPYANEVIIPVYREIPVSSQNETARREPIGDNKEPDGDRQNVSSRQNTSDRENAKKTLPVDQESANKVQRVFSPYSEWLYFKIYCGAKTAEQILVSVILPFIEEGMEDRYFERFFFLRFRDETGGHFRVRFYNTDRDKQWIVYKRLMLVLQPLMDDGTLHRVILDTYKRELERYSPQLIGEAEQLFHNDSLAILRFIRLLHNIDPGGIHRDHYRLLFGMRSIDALLNDFGLSLQHKSSLLKALQAGFFKEFGGHPGLQKQLNERYRKYQRFIAGHMDEKKDPENDIEEAVDIFSVRSGMNIPLARKVLSSLEDEAGPDQLNYLLSSYIHLSMNRLFINQQRKYELVVYHFLEKYYASCIALTQKEKKNVLPLL